jgi:dynein heavy chain 2
LSQDQGGDGGRGSVALIKEWKELLTEVGDHQSLVASLKDSPFFGAFKEEAAVWEIRLATLSECAMQVKRRDPKNTPLVP